jgi:hypothetical protein
MGSGLESLPLALASIDDALFVGGWFIEAGAKPSYYIAKWTEPAASVPDDVEPIVAECRLHQSSPNPMRTAATIAFSLERRSPVRLEVVDVGGRRVATLHSGALPAGEHTVTWDGRLASGEDAAPGVYFYTLQAEGRMEARKLLLLR